MKFFFKFKSSLPSLRKKYYVIFLTISIAILVIIGGYTIYSYQSFQNNLRKNLEVSANSIMEELERGFDDNEAFLKYLGEVISRTQSHQDSHRLAKILTSTGEFNIRSLATSYVSWATDEGFIIVSGKEGILHHKKAF